jgi:hypothetical protein
MYINLLLISCKNIIHIAINYLFIGNILHQSERHPILIHQDIL